MNKPREILHEMVLDNRDGSDRLPKSSSLQFNIKVFSDIGIVNEKFLMHRHPLVFEFTQKHKLSEQDLD